MGTKNDPGNYNCHANAEPDEPIFTLRANDPLAPSLVQRWAHDYLANGGKREKADEALKCASDMIAWKRKKTGQIRGD